MNLILPEITPEQVEKLRQESLLARKKLLQEESVDGVAMDIQAVLRKIEAQLNHDTKNKPYIFEPHPDYPDEGAQLILRTANGVEELLDADYRYGDNGWYVDEVELTLEAVTYAAAHILQIQPSALTMDPELFFAHSKGVAKELFTEAEFNSESINPLTVASRYLEAKTYFVIDDTYNFKHVVRDTILRHRMFDFEFEFQLNDEGQANAYRATMLIAKDGKVFSQSHWFDLDDFDSSLESEFKNNINAWFETIDEEVIAFVESQPEIEMTSMWRTLEAQKGTISS